MRHYAKNGERTFAVYASIFLILALGIAIGGHVSYRNFEDEFKRQAGKQISAIARLKADQLTDWRQERLIDAQFFFHNSVFSGLAERYFENPADVEAEKQIISRLEYYQSYAHYAGVYLLDADGTCRLVIPANSEEFPKADALLISESAASLNSGNIVFGDFQRDPNADGQIYIPILIPLFADQSDGHPLGTLILRINPETYLYPHINQWPIPSNTAETLLVRRDGQDVLFLNQIRFHQDAALNLRYPLTRTDIPAVKAVLGQTGLVEGVDYRGESVLADVRPIADSPWFMVSKVDTAEVYTPLRERLWQTLLIVGLAILVAGAGLIAVWRQQRLLFYRTQAGVSAALRESEEKFRKAFVLSPDSININRLEDGMYVSINNGFTKITGYTAAEVIGKTSLELNIWADPHDRQMLVDGLRKNGQVENLEMCFCMKNGDIKYGLMSASVLELNGIPHIISITRDISERRQAEEILKLTRFSIEAASDAMFWMTADARIVDVNTAACRSLGYTREELLQLKVPDVDVHYKAEIWPQHFDDLRQAGSLIFESEHRAKDGRLIPVEIAANYVQFDNEERNCAFVRDITGRRQAEQALKQSEEQYRLLVENQTDLVVKVDNQNNFLYVSPSYCKVFGKTESELLGHSFIPLVHEDDVAATQNEMKKLYQFPYTCQVEQRAMTKDGWRWLIWSDTAEINQRHEVVSIIGVGRDITDRKQAEEALFESEERFRTLYDNATIGLYRTTPDGRILMLNPAGVQMLGFDFFEEIARRNLETTGFDTDYSRSEFCEKLEREGVVIGLESKWTRKDGSTIFVRESAKAFRDASGKILHYDGSFEDISERVRAESALRESEKLYRKMNENSPLGMHFYKLVGEKLIFSGANPAADTLLGVDHSRFIGKTIEEAFPSLIQTAVPQRYREAAAMGTPWSTEQISYQDRQIKGAFEVKAFQTTAGNMVAVFADITLRKQAEEKIFNLNVELEERVRQRTVQLETANKELEAFSYSVSHDLRAPLRGIDGWSQALLEDYQDQLDQQGQEYIGRVRSETQRMGYLIDDMLQLSRLTRASMVREEVDLSALAQSIAGRLKEDAPQRQVNFIIQPGITAQGDPRLLEAVFSNLLENAFKFTANCAEANIEFGQVDTQGRRVFFVRDNGAGFDMAYAQKLFGAFQRMHRASEFPGTGVGLAIVQRIIHRHGGQIWAQAEVGRGAVFHFTLEEKT